MRKIYICPMPWVRMLKQSKDVRTLGSDEPSVPEVTAFVEAFELTRKENVHDYSYKSYAYER